jgi:glycosyltransferase involved in cell wall biosynthesis
MKILFLSPNQIHRYNWGHQLFRNEIGKQHDVLYYGEKFPKFNKMWNVKQIIKRMNFSPDIIMTYGWRYSKDFEGLGQIKNIPKVHITVDYGRPSGIPLQNKLFAKNKYDLAFVISKNAYNLQVKNKVCDKIVIIPFSVDTNVYRPLGLKKKNKILAAYTRREDIYPNRIKARHILINAGFKVNVKRVVHGQLIKAINTSKITITSNNIFRSLSMRYTETLSCGGFLLADRPDDLDMVGLKDGVHLVIYKDLNDLVDKAKYYMSHNKERKRIEKRGMDFVRKNHSCKVRVKQMTQMIKEELGI